MPTTRRSEITGPKRALGYARVGTEELSRNEQALEAQTERIRTFTAAAGVTLVDVERDQARSGIDPERPGLRRALTRIAEGEADALVVTSFDRLAQSVGDVLRILADLEDADCHLLVAQQQFNTATHRIAADVLLALAEIEAESVKSRCRFASKGCGANRGGRTPFGYDRVEKQLVVNEHETAILQMIHDHCLAKETWQEIADWLNERKLRAKDGGIWHTGNVSRVYKTWLKRNPHLRQA
jgi:DNA invertase Pin-like site-specific DNA recombinase